MKPLFAFIILLFSGLITLRGEAHKLVYYSGTLQSAKNKAIKENKMVFVKFYADWCVPCKWMDETTYSDPIVVKKIGDNFIPLKVNIDDFDGFALRQELAIRILPTVIIFDSKGKMIKRIEETLPPSRMNSILEAIMANNGIRIVHKVNQAPSKIIRQSITGTGNRKIKKSYKLQLGVFKGFENTMKFLDDIKDKVNEQAMVLHDYKDGHTMYRLYIGRYATMEAAVPAQANLKNIHGLESVIY